jgi:hypothetical protein
MPRLVTVLAGKEEAVNLGPIATDPTEVMDSAGDDERVLGGADAFERLCEIVPIVVDVLIKYGCENASSRTGSADDPRGRGATILEDRGDGGGFSVG